MKILASWSSGKDSAWMLHVLRSQGVAPAALLTTMNEEVERVSMHAVRADLLRAQADAVGLPLMTVNLPAPCSNDIYEGLMAIAVDRAIAEGFTHVAFGDIFLEDVRLYREDRLAGTGLSPLFPLWGRPTGDLAAEIIDAGVEAYVTCVDPRLVPASFAGRRFDDALLAELSPRVDPCGERGEFHTCVVNGPMFSKRINVTVGETVEIGGFVFTDLIREGAPLREPGGATAHGWSRRDPDSGAPTQPRTVDRLKKENAGR